MKKENVMQRAKERFIKRTVLEAEKNLEQTLREFGIHVTIIPYRKKEFLRIKEYIMEINKEAATRPIPFKATILKEFPGEIRFAYI